MVIVITSILGTMVAMFIRSPVQAYFDTAQRAEVTDAADTAVRRMARDIQNALPNSVRVDAGNIALEFVPILDVGRYCADTGLAAPAFTPPQTACTDALNIGAPDNAFFALEPFPVMAAGNFIVVYNLDDPASNVYAGTNRTTFVSQAGNIVSMNATTFPLASPSSRFHVVAAPVTYFCDLPGRRLLRYANYPIQAVQPTTLLALNALVAPAVLATNITRCELRFDAGLAASQGLATINLTLASVSPTGGIPASVVLQHQVNVNNTP